MSNGPGSSNLTYAQGKGQADFFVKQDETVGMDASSNDYAPVQWANRVNNVPEHIDYTNAGPWGYGQIDQVIELDKRSTYVGRIQLMYKRGAVTGYTGGSYARFHDWEGYTSIDRVVFEYMQKDVLVLRGDELLNNAFLLKDNKWRTREARGQHGNLTENERNILGTGTEAATNGVWVNVDLQCPWEKIRKQIPIISLPNKIRVHVFFKPLTACIQSDATGSAVCTVSQLQLRCFCDHLSQAQQKKVDTLVKSVGYSIHIQSAEYQLANPWTASDPSAGDQTWTFDIKNLKNYEHTILVVIRPQSKIVVSGLTKTLDYQSYIVPSQYWLTAGGNDITKRYEGIGTSTNPSAGKNNWSLNDNNSLAFPNAPNGQYFCVIPLTRNSTYENENTTTKADDNSYGGRLLNRYNNLQLQLLFSQNNPQIANGVTYLVDIYGWYHNTMFYIQGDFRRYLI